MHAAYDPKYDYHEAGKGSQEICEFNGTQAPMACRKEGLIIPDPTSSMVIPSPTTCAASPIPKAPGPCTSKVITFSALGVAVLMIIICIMLIGTICYLKRELKRLRNDDNDDDERVPINVQINVH